MDRRLEDYKKRVVELREAVGALERTYEERNKLYIEYQHANEELTKVVRKLEAARDFARIELDKARKAFEDKL